jgi:putative lipoic acid-binding regulatory protein
VDGVNEDLLSFPTEFPIKVMGRSAPDFVDLVRGIIEAEAGPLDSGAVTTRDSRDGNFLAVTITFTATSRAQLDAIYEALSSHERVIVAL